MCRRSWNRTAFVHGLLLASLASLVLPAVAAAGEAKSPEPKPAAASPAAAPETAEPSETSPAAKPAGTPTAGPENQVVRVYSLRYTDGQTVGLAIQQVALEAQVVFDSKGDRLIVTCPPSAHERVAEVLETLDVPPPEEEDRVLEVYSLRLDVDACRFLGEAVPDAYITASEPSNRLIVWASPADQERVQEFIEALEVPPDRDQVQSQVTQVYQLQHIDPASALGVLRELLAESADVRMTVSESNNAIVVSGTLASHLQVETLLEKLDIPVDTLRRLQVKVFNMVNADAATLAEMILELFDDARISVDPRANAIVAMGSEETLAVIEAVLLRLDDETYGAIRETPSTTLQVRVVWLVSGPDGEGAAKLAGGVRDVIEELARADLLQDVQDELAPREVSRLRQAGRVLINATPGADFQVSCTPRLDEGPTDMQIHGSLEWKQDMPVLDIEITGTLLQKVPLGGRGEEEPAQMDGVPRGELVSLATQITAPFGQYVVLGVTPAADLTSVFVVQVTRK